MDGYRLIYIEDASENGDYWGVGCSHGMSGVIGNHPELGRFTPVCSSDTYPGYGIFGWGGANLTFYTGDSNQGGVVSAEIGGITHTAEGLLLAFNAVERPCCEAHGVAVRRLDLGGYPQGETVWLTDTDGSTERDPVVGRIGEHGTEERFLVGWRTTDDDAFHLDAQPEEWARLGLPPLVLPATARRAGPGCPTCQYVGYRGRVGIFEILPFTPELKALIKAGADEADLWDAARSHGLSTLLEDALAKVAAGVTTLDEVARLVPVKDYPKSFREAVAQTMGLLPLPDEPVEVEPDLEATISEPFAAEPEPEPEPEPAVPRRERPLVLVVDDAPEIRELVIMSLEDEFEMVYAVDGQDGLERIQELEPDLVLLDVMMPRKTGYELCSELKLTTKFKSLPVLMLSARGNKQHVKQGLYAGADDYLAKPFDPEELLLRSRALLRRSGWDLL
jgi:CheY-like chemotaxis protein